MSIIYFRIQFRFGEIWGSVHGGNTGSIVTETYLNYGEYVDEINLRHGWIVDGFTFYTQNGRYIGQYGHGMGSETNIEKRGFAFMSGKQCTSWDHGTDALCDIKFYFLYPF